MILQWTARIRRAGCWLNDAMKFSHHFMLNYLWSHICPEIGSHVSFRFYCTFYDTANKLRFSKILYHFNGFSTTDSVFSSSQTCIPSEWHHFWPVSLLKLSLVIFTEEPIPLNTFLSHTEQRETKKKIVTTPQP